jgi:mannose-1-phosphate guanylyltransferase / phosphomannomutase
MRVVVMAGGEGQRLRPLTINRPKPMIPLVNRPVMGHILEWLKRHDLTDIVVTLRYRAEDIQNYFGDGSSFGVTLNYSIEQRPLGTAGSVKNAEKFLSRDEPFLIVSGDALTDISLTPIVEFHRRVGAAFTLALYRVPNPPEYGVITVNEAGRIERFLEKPSWGQVISDTVNTGIYVADPEILDEIDSQHPFDFSKDLFPRLIEKGVPLYGYVADGYWTDVGTLNEYHQASDDLLTGKVDVGEIGREIQPGIFAGEEVEIAAEARLTGPVYLGSGVQIKANAVIRGPAAIDPFTIVDQRAHIDHSLIWRNAYIGEAVELRGAVVGARCSLNTRAVVFEGAVIGDESTIGAGAVIHPNVRIWPQKQVEEGATLRTNLIWGSQARRALFGRFGITGLVNVDLTPEFAARLGAAVGTTLPKGSTVLINRDPHRSPRMIKRAIISGLPSAGVNVLDIKTAPIPIARYYTRMSVATGGVHVRLSPYDPRTVDVRIFGSDGQNLSKPEERRIENIFFREDFRRVYLDDIGRIEDAPGAADKRYSDDFVRMINADALRAAGVTLVVDYANAPSAFVLPALLDRLGLGVVALNERIDENRITVNQEEFQRALDRLAAITSAVAADLGVRLDVGGERIWLVDRHGQKVSGPSAAAAFAELLLTRDPGGAIAVPINQPNIFETLAARHHARVMRVKIDPQALMEAAMEPDVRMVMSGAGDFILPGFQPAVDGMMALAKLLELLTLEQTTLADVVKDLPPYYMAQRRVYCPWEHKGTVLRMLNEQYKDSIVNDIDGIKLGLNSHDWVLISPNPDEPVFHVYAEADTRENANMHADRYARIIEGLRE